MAIKPVIADIVGKRIASVVISETHTHSPRVQIFLVFDDGTAFEFYGDDMNTASSLDNGGTDAVLGYVQKREDGFIRRYPAN